MRNRIFHVMPVIFVLFIMFVSGSGFVFAAGQDNAAINKVRLDFNTAFNEGNAEAMGRLIDKDGVWMPPGEPVIIGKDKVVARYTDYFTKVRSKFELKSGEIRLCKGLAFMSGSFVRADAPKTGGAVKEVIGHYLFVLKKQSDGTWKIISDIWNEPVKP